MQQCPSSNASGEMGAPVSGEFWGHSSNRFLWAQWSGDKEALHTERWAHPRSPQHRDCSYWGKGESDAVPKERAREFPCCTQAPYYKAKANEAVVSIGVQTEPMPVEDHHVVRVRDQSAQTEIPPGGIANRMRISQYRCALCQRKFNQRQWVYCGGSVWNPNTSRMCRCYACCCKFDDECPSAGLPCPCCGKVKAMRISDQSGSMSAIKILDNNVVQTPASGVDAGICSEPWCDEQGVTRCIYEV